MKKIFTFFAALACTMSMSAATLYLRGDFNNWGTTNPLDANGKCEIELAVGNYGFKIADANWSTDNYGSNATITATTTGVKFESGSQTNCTLKATTAGTYIFAFNASTLTLDVTYPEGEVVEIAPTVALAGAFNTWSTTANTLTNDSENLTATTTIALTVGNHEFKVVEDGAWLGDNQTITRSNNSQVFETVNGQANCILNADAAGEYTFTWTYKTNTLTVTYPEAGDNPGNDSVVTPVAYYVTGNDALFGANAWKSDAIAMTEAEGVYTHTFTAVEAGVECQFKITDGTWNHSWGFSNLTTTPAGVTGNNDNNIIFTLAEAGDVVVTFSAEKITITGNFAGSSVVPAQITYVLMGIQGDWTTGIELTKNEGAEWEEYMLLGQTISEGDSVKVVRLEAGVAKHWCGNVKEGVTVTITPDDKNGNIILAPGTYDFYYDVAADAIWIAEAAQSAVDNVILENKATKVIRNGQMYIIRDEVMFNVLGQVVK